MDTPGHRHRLACALGTAALPLAFLTWRDATYHAIEVYEVAVR